MNETYVEPVIEAANSTDAGMAALGLMFVGVALVVLGMFLGAMASRPSRARALVRLRVLHNYLARKNPPADLDPLVESLLRRDIRSLENRLNLDSDEYE